MPRISRGLADDHIYHVINRGNGRQIVFENDDDFAFFAGLIGAATERYSVKVLAWCLLSSQKLEGDILDELTFVSASLRIKAIFTGGRTERLKMHNPSDNMHINHA